MKESYLKKLEEALLKFNINHKDIILKKYSLWYDFLIESKIKDERIIEVLGEPINIAKDYINNNANEDFYLEEDLEKGFNLYIKTDSDNIDIIYSLEEKVNLLVKNIDIESYNITKSENLIKMEIKNNHPRKKKGIIRIEYPVNMKFKNVLLSTQTGDISVLSVSTNKLSIANLEGDIIFDNISAKELKISCEFGNIHGGILKTEIASINSVSSKLNIDYFSCDFARVESITGNINIDKAKGFITSRSMSGNININGNPIENTTNFYISNIFKNE